MTRNARRGFVMKDDNGLDPEAFSAKKTVNAGSRATEGRKVLLTAYL